VLLGEILEILTTQMAAARVRELEEICSTRLSTSAMAELGSVYFTLGDPERALPLAQKAWEWNRKDSGYGMNLAMILKDLGRHEESFNVLQTAYANNADDFYIQLGYSEAMLKAGFWKQAWPIYDNARPTQQGAAMDLRIPNNVREWHGEPLAGKKHKLIVINEGGTGDRISYARWLPKLTETGINWRFYPYDELFPLFARILPREQLLADGEDEPEGFSHWCTSFSLPAKLGVGPNEVPPPLRLKPLPEKVAQMDIQRPDDKPVLGICYRAAEMFQGGRTVRSLSSAQAMRLMAMTGDMIHWVSLMKDERMDWPAANCNLRSWEDTLGLMTCLDGIVTVDTSILHIAGSLYRPIACLLSGNSCWKFGKNGRVPPWYPTAKFYQNNGHGFEDALNRLISDIRNKKIFTNISTAPTSSSVARNLD
jgi:hypothetical protein